MIHLVFEKVSSLLVGVLGLTGGFAETIDYFIQNTLKITFILFSMVLIIGYIRTHISPEKTREFIRKKSNVSGYLTAAALGVVSPFCSCSTIPIYLGFSKAGIPSGMTLTFLFVSPMVNTAAVVVLLSVMGIVPTVMYILGGVVVGVTGGFFLSKTFFRDGDREVEDLKVEEENMSHKHRLIKAFEEAKKIVKEILPYVLIGFAIGAVIRGYMPEEFIGEHLTGNLAVPGAVVLGIPVYTNIMGVIPVVGSLISKGLPMGTAVSFMMSVAALSLPQFMMLKKVMTKKQLAAYGVTLGVGIIVIGIIGNFLI